MALLGRAGVLRILPHRSSSKCVLAKQTQLSHNVPCRLQTLSIFDFFQVSLNSDPKVVAGKIAHCSRSDCPPTVLAIGQGCLNQAIKVCHKAVHFAACARWKRQQSSDLLCPLQAVAIARRFCMQPQTHNDMAFDLSCQPAFRENSTPARASRCTYAYTPWCLHDLHHQQLQ